MTTTTDPDRWRELGAALIRRRIALSPRFHNRGAFCEATGLKYRLVYDIEEYRRTNFGDTTLTSIEVAYQLEPGTIKRFLDGGSLDSGASAGAVPESPADIDWPIPPREGTPFTTQTLKDAAPFAYEANGRLRDLRREGVDWPSGAELYPDDTRAAFAYDTVLAAGHTPEESVQYVATVQGQAERARREQHRDRSGTRGA